MTDAVPPTPLSYKGLGPDLFRLAFGTGVLTILTLGIYRFWARTRIRKHIWSSTRADGDTFEYTGTGLEKLLGFLIAVVFLAVYLGIIQIVLFYFGLTVFVDPDTATPQQALMQMAAVYISFLAVVPFLFYAAYRARRYMLARTRWRGVRFGMDQAAWGYAFRAIGHWLLTILTLGALLPRQTFYLEKYMTDRSYFGSARFAQGGSWKGLYRGLRHVFLGLGLMVLMAVLGMAGMSPVLAAILAFVGYIWLFCGLIYYRAFSIGYLNDHKTLEGGAALAAAPSPGAVVGITVKGTLLLALIGAILGGIVTGFGALVMNTLGTQPGIGLVIGTGFFYLLFLVLMQALVMVMITQPVLAHHIDASALRNAAALDAVRQREAAKGLDAGGFADALDVGGAI